MDKEQSIRALAAILAQLAGEDMNQQAVYDVYTARARAWIDGTVNGAAAVLKTALPK